MPDRPLRLGCQELLTGGVKSIVLKMGAKGSLFVTEDEEQFELAFDLLGYKVFDTTGAGDCFDAGFLDGRLIGLPSSESMVLGNATAYCMITSRCGMEGLRHQRSLNAVLLNMIQADRGIHADYPVSRLVSILGSKRP